MIQNVLVENFEKMNQLEPNRKYYSSQQTATAKLFFAYFQRPKCRDLSTQRRSLKRRSLPEISIEGTTEVDVRAQQLDVLDPQIGLFAVALVNQIEDCDLARN